MTAFKDNAPLRLSLPWLPPINVDEQGWQHSLGDRVEDAKLYDILGYFNRYEVSSGQIHFYMHPRLRKNALTKALRHSQDWKAFKRDNPEAVLTWADELQEKAQ